MVKIIETHLTVEGLKLYQQKSPSKWKDKFGDLDLDNIPKEYMRIGQFPTFQQDGSVLKDNKGNAIFHEEEYFDAIQYRKDLIAKIRPKTPVIEELKKAPVVVVDVPTSSPDMSPSHIGEEPK